MVSGKSELYQTVQKQNLFHFILSSNSAHVWREGANSVLSKAQSATVNEMADIGPAGQGRLTWPATGDHIQTKGDRRRWPTLVRLVRAD